MHTVDEMMKIPFPSYHKPLEIAREKGRSKVPGDREYAAEFLAALNKRYPHVLAIGQELVFVLMELNRHPEAESELERFEQEFPTLDEEFLSRWGRLFKDRGDTYMGFPWLDALSNVNPGEAKWYYRKSLEKYDLAYKIRSGHYPGINKAMLLLMLGALKVQPGDTTLPDEVHESEDLAGQIIDSRPRWTAVEDDDQPVWFPATIGEAHLIRQDWRDAEANYRAALRWGKLSASSRESMRRQVVRIVMCFEKLNVSPHPPFDDLTRLFSTTPETDPATGQPTSSPA